MWGWLLRITSGAVKDTAGAVHEVVGTAKDLQDIEKGKIDKRLAERQLEREQSLIHKATFEDVKKFDPNYERLHISVGRDFCVPKENLLARTVAWALKKLPKRMLPNSVNVWLSNRSLGQ